MVESADMRKKGDDDLARWYLPSFRVGDSAYCSRVLFAGRLITARGWDYCFPLQRADEARRVALFSELFRAFGPATGSIE